MPKLVLLNGPPGVGKSTLAQRYAEERPLTLALDIDTIRGLIGSWRENAHESGLAARRIAVAAAAAHLRSGHDVVVPQLLTRREFVEELRATAGQIGAAFHEVTLIGERGAVLARAYAREERAGAFGARALVTVQGGSLEDSYDRFMAALAERPDAVVIDADTEDGAYDALVAYLGP